MQIALDARSRFTLGGIIISVSIVPCDNSATACRARLAAMLKSRKAVEVSKLAV
jgi:hypothetical protein